MHCLYGATPCDVEGPWQGATEKRHREVIMVARGLLRLGAAAALALGRACAVRDRAPAAAGRAGWAAGDIRSKMFRHTYCAARLQTLDQGAR